MFLDVISLCFVELMLMLGCVVHWVCGGFSLFVLMMFVYFVCWIYKVDL